MLKFPFVEDVTKGSKSISQKFVLAEPIALDGAELIPVNCGGRLISQNISFNEMGKLLLNAASEGDVEETKSLLNRGVLFTADWLGTSPLHLAARHNHVEICEMLLKAGISRDARTKVDKTSLHIAAYEGHLGVVNTLLEFGADSNCKDLLGMTPLHWAVQNGHVHVVKSLLKHFAQTDSLNKFYLSPLDIATQLNRQDIIDMLSTGGKYEHYEPELTTQHLTLQMCEDEDNIVNASPEQLNSQSTTNSPIPLETILLEGSDNSMDPDRLQISQTDDSLDHNQDNHFAESMKILQEHGITMLPHDDTNILSTVMESGHSVVLTEVGKEVLKSLKDSEQKLIPQTVITSSNEKRKIITLTADEFLAMTSNGTLSRTNILKQINGRLVPKNVKRIVMKKNKVVPVSDVNNINKVSKTSHSTTSSTDMETVMTQLIEARKTIEEYKMKLMKKEQEAEKYKILLKQLMEDV